MSQMPIFAGVDVGGTNTKVGLVSDTGEVLGHISFPTEQSAGPDFALRTATRLIGDLMSKADLPTDSLVAAGIATPGPMDIPRGLVLTPFNLDGWRNFNVRDAFASLIKCPVEFSNDAGAAAYGEYWIGSGREYASMILITLGTGVGGGIVINGESLEGSHSHGAEIGHMTVDISDTARVCSCRSRGHLEAYSSATAIVARCHALLNDGANSCLRHNSSAEPITALAIASAAEEGDALALDLIAEVGHYLAAAITSLAHVIDPEAVLLGGAMNFGGQTSELGRNFIEQIRQRSAQASLPVIANNLRIDFASLGSDAGFVGAAGLARHRFSALRSASA